MKYSVVVPIFNLENLVNKLFYRILKSIKKVSRKFEIILIDDASDDNSFKIMKLLKKKNYFLKILRNKKNIGQHLTIIKGLRLAEGKRIFVLDGDLQDKPEFFLKFAKNFVDNKTLIIGLMNQKSYSKGLRSILFWNILNLFSNIYFPSNYTNFMLFSDLIKKKILKLKNYGLIYGDVCKLGFNVKFIQIIKNRRDRGKSGYTFLKHINLATKLFRLYVFQSYIYKKN